MLVASTFTQIFEKCIYNQLINYIEKHKIIFQLQYMGLEKDIQLLKL